MTPQCAPALTPGISVDPSTAECNCQHYEVQFVVRHSCHIVTWLSGPVFTSHFFCPGIIPGSMTPHLSDQGWSGVIISQSEASTRDLLTNERLEIWETELEWRVDMAKGQDEVHYLIQMCGELKIRNVNMRLATLIRYSWSVFSSLMWRGWVIFSQILYRWN